MIHLVKPEPALEAFVGQGRPLDPDRYFFVLPAQFGDGFSSSPSNTPPPFDRGAFPPVAISDDVRAQHQLVTAHLGISQLALVSGRSMGGPEAGTVWGHFTMFNLRPQDTAEIDEIYAGALAG